MNWYWPPPPVKLQPKWVFSSLWWGHCPRWCARVGECIFYLHSRCPSLGKFTGHWKVLLQNTNIKRTYWLSYTYRYLFTMKVRMRWSKACHFTVVLMSADVQNYTNMLYILQFCTASAFSTNSTQPSGLTSCHTSCLLTRLLSLWNLAWRISWFLI